MTKQERLHWLYTVLLIIAIGVLHVVAGVKIAYRLSSKYTDKRINMYDSLIVAPQKKETQEFMRVAREKQDSSLYIQKQILKILQDGRRN